MIILNGKKYAKNDSEMVASLFQGPETANGFYKVRKSRKSNRVAIEFFNLQKEPMALISPDAVIVTAFRGDDGKTRYMFGMTKQSREFLGLVENLTIREERDMATEALAEVILN